MTIATAWRALLAEGPRSGLARALDRAADQQRASGFLQVSPATLRDRLRRPLPVLNVLGVPLRRDSGGVEQQFMARRAVEEATRDTGCLVRAGTGWTLEVATDGQRLRLDFADGSGGDRGDEAAFERTIEAARAATGALSVHVENSAGLPLLGLARTAGSGLPLLLSVHDLSLVCPRPYRLAAPATGGCQRSGAVCELCARDPALPREFDATRHAKARSLLDSARHVIFPSEFLRTEYRRVLDWNGGGRSHVIPPAVPLPPSRPWRGEVALQHVAHVGSVRADKGAGIFLEVAAACRRASPSPRLSSYGGGHPSLLASLRRECVAIHGYYRAGSLVQRLIADRVDLVLMLSTWPESHSLALDECMAAGVPVLAFDHGALGERLRSGGGLLVAPAAGAGGVTAALADMGKTLPHIAPPRFPISTPAIAAEAFRRLYIDVT
ncbi:MAG: glycosyltransferase [Acidobacteriota bacterium]